MTKGEAMYYHGRMSLAWAVGSGIGVALGITATPLYFVVGIGFALMAGWHVGNVLVRSL